MLRGVEGSPAGHPGHGRDSRLSTIGCQEKKQGMSGANDMSGLLARNLSGLS
jgi:hypothetical protein